MKGLKKYFAFPKLINIFVTSATIAIYFSIIRIIMIRIELH